MSRKELKQQYDKLCDEYIKIFERKHGYEFSCRTENIVCFIDQYFFGMEDIIHDINHKIKKNLIFEWQDSIVEEAMVSDTSNVITFREYVYYNKPQE